MREINIGLMNELWAELMIPLNVTIMHNEIGNQIKFNI